MNVYRDISEINFDGKAVVTIGTFDGIHKGHSDIISFVVNEAADENAESFVVTFEPHPRLVVSQNYDIKILTDLEEKIELFEKLNIRNLLVINFNAGFAELSYEDFLRNYLIGKIHASHIVIGHDHHFGKGRGGDENKLQQLSESLGFRLTVIPAVSVEGVEVSSTKIRNALLAGEFDKANAYLGRNYTLGGIVVEGDKRGRTIGFPTANIEPAEKRKLVPKEGVYAVKCVIESEEFKGVLNIGRRPTFELQDKVFIELHVLDFEGDVYGKKAEVEFISRLRDEVKFTSVENLVNQIKQDVQKAREILK